MIPEVSNIEASGIYRIIGKSYELPYDTISPPGGIALRRILINAQTGACIPCNRIKQRHPACRCRKYQHQPCLSRHRDIQPCKRTV